MPNLPALSGLRNNFWAIHGSMAAVAAGATAAGFWGPSQIRFGTGIVFGMVGTLAVWQADQTKKASKNLEDDLLASLVTPAADAVVETPEVPVAVAAPGAVEVEPVAVGGDLFRDDVFELGSFDDEYEELLEAELVEPEAVVPVAEVATVHDLSDVGELSDEGQLADEAVAGWPGHNSAIVPNLPRQAGPRKPVQH